MIKQILIIPLITGLYNFAFAQPFAEVPEGLPDLGNSAAVWADFDNDGWLDIAITGVDNNGIKQAGIYQNNQDGTFSSLGVGLAPVTEGSLSVGDINNDGLPDLLLTGSGISNERIARLYVNQGNGVFTTPNIGLDGLAFSTSLIFDYNNDGRQDLFLMGVNPEGNRVTHIYSNQGGLSFTMAISLEGLSQGGAARLDFNRDGYIDLFLNGIDNANQRRALLYLNNANGTFNIKDIAVPGIGNGEPSVGDYNSDGFPDLFMSGRNITGAFSSLYRNNQGEAFVPVPSFPAVTESMSTWCDFNSSGDIGLFFAGLENTVFRAFLYENQSGTLVNSGEVFPGSSSGAALFADFKNDGKPGLLLSGFTTSAPFTLLYENNSPVANTPPNPPQGLVAIAQGDSVVLSWERALDNETSTMALGYNIMLGSSPNAFDIVSPLADIATGRRKVTGFGALADTFAVVKNLPEGEYFWSVQTVDQGYTGSAFAPGESFFRCDTINATSQLQGCGDEAVLSYREATPTDIVSWFSETMPTVPFSNAQSPNKTVAENEKAWVVVTREIGCQVSDTLALSPNPPTVVDLGTERVICIGDSVSLGGQPTASGSLLPYGYTWSPAESLDNVTSANPLAKPQATTTYQLVLSTGNCIIDTVFTTVMVNPLPLVDAGEDIALGLGETATLNATGAASYVWSPNEGLDSPTLNNPMASPEATVAYTVVGTDDNGCVNSDSLTVRVRQEVFVPALFTPNGDGQNDRFFVYGVGVKQINLKVYDRWGRQVFESDDINQGWDGQANGNEAENGQYLWVVEGEFFNGEPVVFDGKVKGVVKLLR